MGQLGRFDTDKNALERRLDAHARFGTADFDGWLLGLVRAEPGDRILDLGCGTGKQALPLARVVGLSGLVLALDAAQESLDSLNAAAGSTGVGRQIRTVQARLDEVPSALGDVYLDRVISSYAIYYVEEPDHLFTWLAEHLRPGGTFVACGPAADNNAEIKRFHEQVSGRPVEMLAASQFMEETLPNLLSERFASVARTAFENSLVFDSSEALYDYWRSYNLYDPELDASFRRRAERHFEKSPTFGTVKRVVGVTAIR